MENRNTLTDRVCSLEPSVKREDVLLPVDFNLTPSHHRTRVDGLTVLLRDRILCWIDGEKKTGLAWLLSAFGIGN